MIMSDEYKKTYSKVWELFLRWLSSDRCVENTCICIEVQKYMLHLKLCIWCTDGCQYQFCL